MPFFFPLQPAGVPSAGSSRFYTRDFEGSIQVLAIDSTRINNPYTDRIVKRNHFFRAAVYAHLFFLLKPNRQRERLPLASLAPPFLSKNSAGRLVCFSTWQVIFYSEKTFRTGFNLAISAKEKGEKFRGGTRSTKYCRRCFRTSQAK